MARLYMMSCHLHNLWANTAVRKLLCKKEDGTWHLLYDACSCSGGHCHRNRYVE